MIKVVSTQLFLFDDLHTTGISPSAFLLLVPLIKIVPTQFFFGNLNTAGIIPSTFLLGKYGGHPLTKPEDNNRSNVSQTIDYCSVRCPRGFPIWKGVLDSIYEEIFGGGRSGVPRKRKISR